MSIQPYQPSSGERDGLKMAPGELKVSGDGVFFTVQGEGQSLGKPAVFLRLHFCNLRCGWCDTKYTWDKNRPDFWQENQNWTIERTVEAITQYRANRLVITGGEPLLQQGKIAELIDGLPDWAVEVETNGTIAPDLRLAARVQFNVSPKLENSGNSRVSRYKPDVLRKFDSFPQTTFKFVVESSRDFPEIEEIVADCGLDPEKIILSPQGTSTDETRQSLLAVVESAKERGWRLMPRMHVLMWGDQRRR